MRLPALVHQPGMQDEQWFAVPGLTVLEEGIPRIPYLPTRRRETLFENADVCLMALPPGLFYVQAPFFAIFPAGYATARIPLFLAALVAIAVLSLWLPLILAFPDEFRSQFFANVLDRAGPGLPIRLLWPLPSLRHHATLLWEFAGPVQTLMMLGSLLFASMTLWQTRRDRFAIGYIALAWSSVYLTATVAGLHPTKGYWMYPFLWLIAMLVIALRQWADTLATWIGRPRAGRGSFAVILPQWTPNAFMSRTTSVLG